MARNLRYHHCPVCQGNGQVADMQNQGQALDCPACKGSGEKEFLRLLRWYHLFDGSLTALQSLAYVLQIEPTADFEWVALVATSTGTFTTTMKDASGRSYEAPATNATGAQASGAVNNANRFGTAQLPFLLPVPEVLPMKTTLNGTITDTSNATNTIQASLWGYELYTQENAPANT